MKAKVLKAFYPPTSPNDLPIYSISSGQIKEGQIIDVEIPIGGRIREVKYKTKKLIVGTDVELISDGPQPIEVNKQQKGSLLFYGGLLALAYIVYKIVTTK
jgi:hypothetical protein